MWYQGFDHMDVTAERRPYDKAFCGYIIAELHCHLERQFKGRMSWAAFLAGKIHIDHIVPLSSFDLSDEREFRAAWALSNLRPMWAKANLEKASKRVVMI